MYDFLLHEAQLLTPVRYAGRACAMAERGGLSSREVHRLHPCRPIWSGVSLEVFFALQHELKKLTNACNDATRLDAPPQCATVFDGLVSARLLVLPSTISRGFQWRSRNCSGRCHSLQVNHFLPYSVV